MTVEIMMESVSGDLDSDGSGPVTGTNFYDNSVIHSGFLTGSVDSETSVDIVLVGINTGDYSTATGTTSWTFQLPTGADTWKDGSSHTIRVRGRLGDGSKTAENTYMVRKGVNRDMNGDGMPGMLVSATGYNSSVGCVYLFPGDPSGPDSSSSSTFVGSGNGSFF